MICLSWECYTIQTSVLNTKYPEKNSGALANKRKFITRNFKNLFSVQDFIIIIVIIVWGVYMSLACSRSRQTLAVKHATLIAPHLCSPHPTKRQIILAISQLISNFNTHTIPQRMQKKKNEKKKPTTEHMPYKHNKHR